MTNYRFCVALLTGLGFAGWSNAGLAAACGGTSFGASFAGSYTCDDLGGAPGVPSNLGGIAFLDANDILIGGAANGSAGAIYELGVIRDAGNHIIGFSGSATLYATAPFIDGGLSFGPGNVLFFTGYPVNTIGEIKPGSTSPDKIVSMAGLVASSVGSLAFVPSGFAGAGGFKIASYNGGGWYDGTLNPDGTGTYDITGAALESTPGGGPEGIAYVSGSNPGFAGDSVLLDQYNAGQVEAYSIDSNGDPILATGQDFLDGLTGAEGATIDPETGDFLFSTYGGGNQVDVVSGFSAPTQGVPEPASLSIIGGAAAALGLLRRRKRHVV
jgi:hypothetical protein